jgi:hypothetical protein
MATRCGIESLMCIAPQKTQVHRGSLWWVLIR